MSIRVFTAEESLAAITVNPTGTFDITAKKEAKAFKGTTFFNIKWTIAEKKASEGWFNSNEDIPLSRGVADPSDKKDKRNEFEGTRLQLETTVSRAGKTGQFLLAAQKQYRQKVEALQASGVMEAGKPIMDLVSVTYANDAPVGKDGVKRYVKGQAVEDPNIRFKVDFDAFPKEYFIKSLIGQPKTQLYDWNTRVVDEATGKESFSLATVKDAAGNVVPVTATNLHEFVNKGSIIKRIRYMIMSVPQAKGQVSCPIVANKVVIQPGGPEGFSDDFGENPTVVTAPKPNIVDAANNAAPVTAAPVLEGTVSAEDIASALTGL